MESTESQEAFEEYYKQGESRESDHHVDLMLILDLTYRRTIHQQRQSHEQFPQRVQVKRVLLIGP